MSDLFKAATHAAMTGTCGRFGYRPRFGSEYRHTRWKICGQSIGEAARAADITTPRLSDIEIGNELPTKAELSKLIGALLLPEDSDADVRLFMLGVADRLRLWGCQVPVCRLVEGSSCQRERNYFDEDESPRNFPTVCKRF